MIRGRLFYTDLDTAYARTSANGLRLVFGDLNARLHCQQAGEHDVIGDHVFQTGRLPSPNSNRELLLELCVAHSLAVANTFTAVSDDATVTYRNHGVTPLALVTPSKFGQLDLLLAPHKSLSKIRQVHSIRTEPLASQHYLVIADVVCGLEKSAPEQAHKRPDRRALRDPCIRKSFGDEFLRYMQASAPPVDTQDLNAKIVEAISISWIQLCTLKSA